MASLEDHSERTPDDNGFKKTTIIIMKRKNIKVNWQKSYTIYI